MTIGHVEIGTGDAAGTAAFFRNLMGWAFEPMGEAGEGWFEVGGATVGLHGGDLQGGCLPYFAVADLDAALRRMETLGGKQEGDVAGEESFGRFATCVGPEGTRFGLHQRG